MPTILAHDPDLIFLGTQSQLADNKVELKQGALLNPDRHRLFLMPSSWHGPQGWGRGGTIFDCSGSRSSKAPSLLECLLYGTTDIVLPVKELHEDDPRNKRGHKERGPARYSFTYQDLAEAVGLKARSVRNAKVRGEFDWTDLVSVARYIGRHQGWAKEQA
jgi:hypothetical protein